MPYLYHREFLDAWQFVGTSYFDCLLEFAHSNVGVKFLPHVPKYICAGLPSNKASANNLIMLSVTSSVPSVLSLFLWSRFCSLSSFHSVGWVCMY